MLKLLSKIANRKTKWLENRAKNYHHEYRRLKARRKGVIALRKNRIFGFSKRREVLTIINKYSTKQPELERENQNKNTFFDKNPTFEKDLEKVLGKKTKRFLKTFHSIKE